MTRAEIERELLGLPESERAAVLRRVLTTLHETEQAALREELDALEATEGQTLGDRLEAIMLSWSDGPAEEFTEADWQDIRNTRPEEVDPDSWAVPPGWKPPTHR